MKSSVEHLGHVIDANGMNAAQSKITAIQEAPVPTNLTQLRAFFGLVNYYNKFIPNLAHLLHPLNNLFKKDKNGCSLNSAHNHLTRPSKP